MKTTWLLIIALAFALCCGACEEESSTHAQQAAAAEALKARFTDPVGFKIPAAKGVPAFTIVLAFSRGATVETLGNSVVTTLNRAINACPEFVKAAQLGQDSTLSFTLSDGRAVAPVDAKADANTACLRKAVDGAEIPLPPGMTVEVMSRFVFDGGAQPTSPEKKSK